MSVTAPDSRVTTYNPVVSTTEFQALFPVFDNDDLSVFLDGEERSDFAVSATYVEGIATDAKVVFATGLVGRVDVVGMRDPHRTNRFGPGPIPVRDLNLAFDTIEAEMQEARRDLNRSIRAPIGEDGYAFEGGNQGDYLIVGPNRTIIASSPPDGSGNMNTAIYDPDGIADDAFDRANHTGPVVWPVNSIAELKALDTTKFTSAYLRQAGRDGHFIWRSGDFTSLVALDTLNGVYAKADAVAVSSGCWVRQRSGLDVHVLWFGAVADSTGVGNGTNNIGAFNGALALAKALGGNVFLGLGAYRLSSTWVYDKSTINADTGRVPSIYGLGITVTRLYFDAAVAVGIDIIGSMTGGVFGSFLYLRDFGVFSSGKTGHGVRATDIAFMDMTRVRINGWNRGLNLRNVISSRFDRLFSDGNIYGVYLEDGPSAVPCNAVSFFNCWISANDRLGIYALNVATITVDGGSIENNGLVTGGSDPNNSGGMFVVQPGEGGHNSVNVRGVYFEHNRGVADLLIFSSTYETSHLVHGCTFQRISSTEYTTYNVFLNATGGSIRQTLSLSGNGFGKLRSGYVENAARLYVNVDDPNNVVTIVDDGSNTYQSDVAKPNYSAVFSLGEKSKAQAVGWISAAGALSSGSTNVSSVSKISAGRYKITLKRGWVGPKVITATPNLLRAAYIVTYDDTSVTIEFMTVGTTPAAADVDFGFAIHRPV